MARSGSTSDSWPPTARSEPGAGLGDPEAQDLAGDDEPLDLAGALADLGQLGVPQVALDRILGHVAVAAVDLDGRVRHPRADLGSEELGLRRNEAEVPALVLE